MRPIRLIISVVLIALVFLNSGCESDFYLSEAEAATYTNLFINESSANNFLSVALPGQTLRLQFDNTTTPPTLTSTNLLALMRNQTTLGVIEGFNNQVRLERLNTELQKQIEKYVRKELDFFDGIDNADVKLIRLNFINITFLTKPTFTYHPERQTISFNASLRIAISGTIQVDSVSWWENFISGANGTHPLLIQINDLNLNGEVIFGSPFADASQINIKMTPIVGTIGVSDGSSSRVPTIVKTIARDLLRTQFSQPLSATFTQRYNYFSLTGVALVKSTEQPSINLRHTYNAIPEMAKPMMHIVARAADGKLYHQRKTEGGQNIIAGTLPFPMLQTRIENEPELYASATDQLELAATTVSGQLVFAHWRDETWGLQTTINQPRIAGAFIGKPAIIASAPGQVEIIVAGQNGRLWHVRRLNGVWSAPAIIPIITLPNYRTAPYRDPVVALSGNKVVVAFIDSQNRLNASAFDLESSFWGQASPIQTSRLLHSSYAPAIAATGDGQVELVYVGQNGTPFHRVLRIDAPRFSSNGAITGFSIVNSEITIGGAMNATPALVSSSYKQLELIGRGTDNRLYHNHFVGPNSPGGIIEGRTINQGWQGWQGMTENFSGTLTFANMSSFTAGGTGTGKIGVISITQPTRLNRDPEQYLYHNIYDSTRYGRQPWKTVHWRGAERIQTKRFIGKPALAMTDRNLSLNYLNNNFASFQKNRLSENNIFQPSSNISSNVSIISAASTSSIPNHTDIVVTESDNQIRHYRCKENSSCTTKLLPITTFKTYRHLAVVGYGNGFLEVVATTDEGHPYHWRYQNGAWSGATDISPNISYPGPVSLINLGSGRLGLILVNSTDNPAVSYFSTGVWSVPRSFTNFPIESSFFGTQAVKSWGDGAFDYAVVRRQTRDLWHGRLGPREYTGNPLLLNVTPGRTAVNLGGIINDSPVLTVFSPTRMNIIAEGTDNNLYSNWSRPDTSRIFQSIQASPPILWSGYGDMDGNNLKLSDVAKTGANELAIVGFDTNGKLMISRYNGANWLQFQPLMTQSSIIAPSFSYSPTLTTY